MKSKEKTIVLPKDVVEATDSEEEEEMRCWKRADDNYDCDEIEDKIEIPPRRLKIKRSKIKPKAQVKRKIVYEYSSSDDDDEISLPIKRKKKAFTHSIPAPPPTPEKQIQHHEKKTKKEKSNFHVLSKKIRDYEKEWFTPKKTDDVKLFQSAIVNILTNKADMNEKQRVLLTQKNKTKLQNILGVKPSKAPNGQKIFVMKPKVPTTKSTVRNIKNLPQDALKEIATLMKHM